MEPPKQAPMNAKLESIDGKTVKLQWEEMQSEEIVGYEIEVLDHSEANPQWKKVGKVDGRKTTSFTVEQLEATHEYAFRVAAINKAGNGPATEAIIRKAQTPPKEAPENLKLEKVDLKKVRLSWDGVTDAQNYVVEIKDKNAAEKGQWKKAASEVAEQFAVLDLEPTHEYEIRVVPNFQYGVGTASQPVVRQAALPPQKPPTEVHLEEVDPKTAKLTWKTVEEAQKYRVEIIDKQAKKPEWKKVAEETSDLFCVVKDLDPTHEYELRVAAVSETGCGVPSQPVVRHSKKPPQAPTEISVENVSPETCKVQWQTQAKDAESFVIEQKLPSEKEWRKVGEANNEQLSFEVAQLKGDMNYEFRIVPVNEVGRGMASKSALRAAQVPPQQAPIEVQIRDQGEGKKAKIEWKKCEGASQGYIIEQKVAEGEWKQKAKVGEAQTSFEAKELDPFEEFTVRVAGVNEIGVGQASEPVTREARKKAPLKAPENLKVASEDGIACKLAWNPVTCEGRTNLKIKVEMQVLGQDNAKWTVVHEKIDGKTCVIEDLKTDTDYSFRIFAVDEESNETSEASNETTKRGIRPVLTAPAELKLQQTADDSCKLQWSPLKDVPDIKYQVEQRADGKWQILDDKCPDSQFEVKKLKSEPETKFLVRAKASYGAGPPSNEVVFPAVPSKPFDLKFTQDGENKGTLQWKHDRLNGESFNVEVSPGGSGKFKEIMKGIAEGGVDLELKVELTGLKPETDYVFRIRAKNPFHGNFGEYSDECHGKLKGMPPGADCKVVLEKVQEVDSESNKCKLYWERLPENVSKQITGFHIETAIAGTDNWLKNGLCNNPDATSFEVSENIDRTKDLLFRVVPFNDYGLGPSSEPKPLNKRPPQAPKQTPTDLEVYEGNDDKCAVLKWKTLPQLLNCCFSVEKKPVDSDSWEKLADDIKEPKLEVSDLVPDKAYQFRVFAKNEAGRGPASNEVTLASRGKQHESGHLKIGRLKFYIA